MTIYPMEQDWTHYEFAYPPQNLLLRFKQETTGEEWTGYARDIPSEANVAYLMWKLTGIARETLAAMTPHQQEQLMPANRGFANLLQGQMEGSLFNFRSVRAS